MYNTVLALSRFFIENFPNVDWYPYWYLGNPFHFLIGSVVPVYLSITTKLGLALEPAYLGLIVVSFLTGAVGLYKLVQVLYSPGEKKAVTLGGWMPALLFLVLPIRLVTLQYSNGLYEIAFGFLPWIFLLFLRFLTKNSLKNDLLLSLLIAFVLLINVSILLPILVGFVCLAVVRGVREVGEFRVIKAIVVIVFSLSLATVWYTPAFWIALLQNPSIGGTPLLNLGKMLFQLLLHAVPVFAAVWIVKIHKDRFSTSAVFGILFTLAFLFLSIFRFLSDPDFIMDWTGFFNEIQLGMAIVLGSILKDLRLKIYDLRSNLLPGSIMTAVFFIFLFINHKSLIINHIDDAYQDSIVSMLNEVPSTERVFLSGTPVFWINRNLDVQQVRGGVDQVSINPYWAHAAYQIREGNGRKLTEDWLKILGVSYVLVHGEGSKEPFRDFKHPGKFDNQAASHPPGEKKAVTTGGWRGIGDTLYRFDGNSIARIADTSIVKLPKPKDGADQEKINAFSNTIKKEISYKSTKPGTLEFEADLKKGEVVSLAVSYSNNWFIKEGQGSLVQDALGNIVVIPQKEGLNHFSLIYQTRSWEYLAPVIVSFLGLTFLLEYNKLYPHISRRLVNIGMGLDEEA